MAGKMFGNMPLGDDYAAEMKGVKALKKKAAPKAKVPKVKKAKALKPKKK